jgi:hypothetical protein
MDSMVEFCKELAVESMEELLKVLSHVPDDKLNWTPAPTSKSAIRISAHAALYMARFAGMIESRKLPGHGDLDEWWARCYAEETAITTRAQVESAIKQGTERVLAALDALSPEEANMSLDSGMGWSMPMRRLMQMPGLHTFNHSAQIDFLQTCWDDQKVHLEPDTLDPHGK